MLHSVREKLGHWDYGGCVGIVLTTVCIILSQVKVFFLDYGNYETMVISNLYPLHPKFQVYPFQMIQCCFSVSQDLVYEREVS